MESTKTMSKPNYSYQEEANDLQKECIGAIKNQRWDNIIHKTRYHLKELELEQNKLGVFQHENTKNAYYLGQIAAISQICQQLKSENETTAEIHLLKKKFPLLEKCITFIGDNQMVTSGQIVAGLQLKHRSDFSNAMNRQQKYGYIISYKMGNKNLYTLSGKGKKYYLENLISDKKNHETEKEITIFINTLSDITRSGEFNPVIIATEMAKTRTHMKSYYLSYEFNSAMYELKRSYWASIRAKIRELMFKNLAGMRASRMLNTGDYIYQDNTRNIDEMSLTYTE